MKDLSPLREFEKIILFGELHGSYEAPQAFGEAVEFFLSLGTPVTACLELSWDYENLLNNVLCDIASLSELRESSLWNMNDGRESIAMFELMKFLTELRQRGNELSIAAYDDPLNQTENGTRDERMGRRVVELFNRHPNNQFLVLTGNLHSRTRSIPRHAVFKESMAMTIAKEHPVTSVEFTASGGTIYASMQGKDDIEPRVGVHNIFKLASTIAPGTIRKADESSAHDWEWFLGELSAAMPTRNYEAGQ